MGRQKATPTTAVPDTSFTAYCGCCNRKFGPNLRKTRRFMVNVADTEREVGIVQTNETEESAMDKEVSKIVDVSTGLEKILTWRYSKGFTNVIDPKLGLCTTCGLVVAKLYNALTLFDTANSEESLLATIVQKHLQSNDKATDTDQDAVDEAAAAAELEAITYLEEYYPEPDEEITVQQIAKTRQIDNSTKEFQCQYCTAGFDKQANLTRHLLLTHEIGDREKEYRCGVCGKAYYFSYLLRNHELIHGEDRPFVCKVPSCKATFKNKLGLHNHMKYFHRKTRPFKCQYCQKTFKDARNHRNHEHYVHNIPNGHKPHVCQYCGEHFKRASSLPGHFRKKCRSYPGRVEDGQVEDLEVVLDQVEEEEEEVQVETYTIIEGEEIRHAILGEHMEVEEEVTLGLINH